MVSAIQGSQVNLGVQTATDVFGTITLAASHTYMYEAHISVVSANSGTSGVQAGLWCSSVSQLEGEVDGYQTATTVIAFRQTGSGIVTTSAVERGAGNGTVNSGVVLRGVITTSTGTPTAGVQIKGIQASTNWYTRTTINAIKFLQVA